MSDKLQQPIFRQSAPSIGFSPPVPPFFNTTNYTIPEVVNSEHTLVAPSTRTAELRPIVRACARSSIVQPTPLSAMSSGASPCHINASFNTGLPSQNRSFSGSHYSSNTVNQQGCISNYTQSAVNLPDIEDAKHIGFKPNVTQPQITFQAPQSFTFNAIGKDLGVGRTDNQMCNTVLWDQCVPKTFQWGNTANMNEEFGSSSQKSLKSRRVHAKRKAARDSPIPTKVYITEKEMARRISNLNLDGAPVCKNKSLFSELDPKTRAQRQLDEIDRRLQAIEDEEDDDQLEEEMTEDLPKLQLSAEVKNSLSVASGLLPKNILEKIPPSPNPNMQLVLWKPNNDIVKEVVQSVLNNKNRRRGTSPVTMETINQSNGMSVTLNSMDGIDEAPSISKTLPYDNINKRGQHEPLPMDDMD